eukprot:g24985.t1
MDLTGNIFMQRVVQQLIQYVEVSVLDWSSKRRAIEDREAASAYIDKLEEQRRELQVAIQGSLEKGINTQGTILVATAGMKTGCGLYDEDDKGNSVMAIALKDPNQSAQAAIE